jgi:site-specific DNA-methyltransferase (adenine-specific)
MMEFNKIYQGDNINYLQELSDKKILFDLVINDPPYRLSKDFGNDTDCQPLNIFLEELEKRIKLFKNILTENGSIIFFCSHLYVDHIRLLLSKYFNYRRMLIWFYRNGMSRQITEPVTQYEPFLWYTNSNEKWTYNLDDVRVPYLSERVKSPTYKKNKDGIKVPWVANPLGAKRGDIWEYKALTGQNAIKERTEHPTQKPIALITNIIKAFTPKDNNSKYNGKILDPYNGSGTTPVSCEKLNREGHKITWIGLGLELELEEEWVKVSNERLKNIKEEIIVEDIF